MAAKRFLEWVERQALQMRRRLYLGPIEILDPYRLAQVMKVQILSPHDVIGFSGPSLNHLLVADSDSWSAGSILLPNQQVIVVLNPTHAATRKRVTLMEELAHIHLKHSPSQLMMMGDGIAFRSHKKSIETQAYWVGAAALIPLAHLHHARNYQCTRGNLAQECGVSGALVAFREQVTGVKLE